MISPLSSAPNPNAAMPASANPTHGPEVVGHGRSKRDLAAQALEPIVQVVPEEKRRLTGYLLLALLAHVVLFAGVKLTYPESTRQPQPRVRAMLALPQRETILYDTEQRDREFWDQLHDPSMLILPPDKLDADLIALRAPRPGETVPAVSPTEAALASPLAPVTLRQDGTQLPEGMLPLQRRAVNQLLPQPRAFLFVDEEVTPDETSVSELLLSGPLASRQWVVEPALPSPAIEVLPPRGTTVLRLGVDANGQVVHALVLEGSGNASLDLLGLDAVRAGRFAPQRLNLPAQPSRQAKKASDLAPPLIGMTWPAPLKKETSRASPPSSSAWNRAGSQDLTWGEAKIHWRLRAPEPKPKAGPVPPESS